MKKRLRFICFFPIFFICASIFADGKSEVSSYGLQIKSSPVPDAQKTRLVLENNLPFRLGNETSLSFDMRIREDYVFGVIFRIITDKKENIDLMLSVSGTKHHPILVVNELAYMVPSELTFGQWVPIQITFSKVKGEIVLTYDRQELVIPYSVSDIATMKISFGACNFESFETGDIASIDVKDIKMWSDGQLKRYWKLKEHRENMSLDSVSHVPALVVNPAWIIDQYSTWKKIRTAKVPFNSQITFDGKNTFYNVSPDSKTIRTLDVRTKTEDSLPVKSGKIASSSPNTIVYDSLSGRLITYNLSEFFLSEYSFETHSWSSDRLPVSDPYLNNSAVYNPEENMIYSFGGYAYHKYDHNLIKLNTLSGYWHTTELVEIPPRYCASTAIVDNRMYIFGGRGNKSGRQEISPRNYYDLYSIDLTIGQAVLLWKQDSVGVDFLPGENMVFDPERKCFYLFTTQQGGNLLRIYPDKKGFEQVSLPIGADLDGFYLYTNLYFSESQQKLYALICNQTFDQSNEKNLDVSIYELNYPPVPIENLKQAVPVSGRSFLWFIGSVVLTLLVFGYIIGFILSGKRRKKNRQFSKTVYNQGISSDIPEKTYYDFSKSAICFLNGFNVIDKEGNNIKGQFSPTLKNLLILLILSTEKDSAGIFGHKLIQLLWTDKNEEAAKNSRNVYVSKLRSILETVGNFEIINKKGFWTIVFEDNVKCDYTEAMRLFSMIRKGDFNDSVSVNRLLELLLRGVLLPNTEIDWLDNFKSDFSNVTIDILTRLAREKEHRLNTELRLKIADTLFLHDLLNEEALSIKCSILFCSGKKGLAKSVYDNFCKEHYNLLKINYKYSLSEVIAPDFSGL